MKGSYNKKLIPVLEKYGLNEMPEAHNYLRINGEIKDFTTNKSSAEDFRNDLVKEIDEKVRHYYKLDETRENAQEEEDDTLLNLE